MDEFQLERKMKEFEKNYTEVKLKMMHDYRDAMRVPVPEIAKVMDISPSTFFKMKITNNTSVHTVDRFLRFFGLTFDGFFRNESTLYSIGNNNTGIVQEPMVIYRNQAVAPTNDSEQVQHWKQRYAELQDKYNALWDRYEKAREDYFSVQNELINEKKKE